MSCPATVLLRRLAAAAVLSALAACSSDPKALPADNPFRSGKNERELRLEAEQLYRLARRSLEASDYAGAIQRYDQLLLRYPFTDVATHARIDSIFARYRSFDPEGALTGADRFLREHPRHAHADYVQYLKGLVNFQRGESVFEWLVDSTRQDLTPARRAFDDFALLIQRYPASAYAADARLRMIYLRNRLAAHELHAVRYYLRRGAHVAAARRAERILAEYPGAPATHEAVVLLEESYRRSGLSAAADDVRRLRAANGLAAGAPDPAPAAPAGASAPPEPPAAADE